MTCERAFLAALDGNCKTPIAGQARVVDGELLLKGLVASPDGQRIYRTERSGKVCLGSQRALKEVKEVS